MKVFKRVGALALALALALTSLTGCQNSSSTAADSSFVVPESVDLASVTDPFLTVSGLSGDTVVATAGETEITAANVLYWIAYSADSLLSYYGMYGMTELPWDQDVNGATFAETMKQEALTTAALYALIPGMGESEGVSLSEDFKAEFEDSLAQMSEALGGEDLMNHYLWQYPLTVDLYTQLCQSEEINTAVMEALYGEGTEGYPTDAEVLSFLENDQQCYFFKHILFLVEDTTDDSADSSSSAPSDNSAEQKAKAEEVLAQLRASDDPVALFDTLMNEYSEDGGLATYPDGYLGTASDTPLVGNQMVSVVEDAALSLGDWEISDVLENTEGYHGYHIVMRLPLAESVSPADYAQDYISVQMDNLQQEWLAKNEVVTNEYFDRLSAKDFYNALTVLRDAVAAEADALSAAEESSESGSASSSQG